MLPQLPRVRLLSMAALMLLNYANAAMVLPQIVQSPDWDLWALVLACTSALCLFAFATGARLAGVLGATAEERASLMYGLGMNNNGTGLVLAGAALSDHPVVLLVIVAYNLVQQLVAAAANRRAAAADLSRPESSPRPSGQGLEPGAP